MSSITLSPDSFIKVEELGSGNWPYGVENQPASKVVATYKSDGAGGFYKTFPAAGTTLFTHEEVLSIAQALDATGESSNGCRIYVSDVDMYSTNATKRFISDGAGSYYAEAPPADTVLLSRAETLDAGYGLELPSIGRTSPIVGREFVSTGNINNVSKETYPEEGTLVWSSSNSQADGSEDLKIEVEGEYSELVFKQFEATGAQEPGAIREKCHEANTLLMAGVVKDDGKTYSYYADGACGYYDDGGVEPTETPTGSATETPTGSATETPTSSATYTPTSSATYTPTSSATYTPTSSATPTPTPTSPPVESTVYVRSGPTLINTEQNIWSQIYHVVVTQNGVGTVKEWYELNPVSNDIIASGTGEYPY